MGLIGAGLGGVTAAIALARGGAQVTVLEAAAELGEIGAGIQMTPNVSRFLVRWGVSDLIGDDLVQCDDVKMRSTDGKVVAYTDFRDVKTRWGYPWYVKEETDSSERPRQSAKTARKDGAADICNRWVVHRHHLHTGLAESARRLGVRLVIDARVVSIEHSSTPVKVTTAKGAEYSFDLVIGSDGLKSIVRKTLFPNVTPHAPTKNAAYRAVIPYSTVFAAVPEAKSVLGNSIDVWTSPGGYCITYPISGGRDLNLVLSHHTCAPVTDVEEASIPDLRAFYASYDPVIRAVIALIDSSNRWPLLVTGPLPSWSNAAKTVVLMGDAAHSMVNHMAQGAATAMEDGAFLGRVVADVVRGVLTLPDAVAVYEKTRMPRAWVKQQMSFTAGEIYMACAADQDVRNASSVAEVAAAAANVVKGRPGPEYRSWNIWGCPDTVPGVYTYDAEGDAEFAVARFLAERGEVDERTGVAGGLRDLWWGFEPDKGVRTKREREREEAKL